MYIFSFRWLIKRNLKIRIESSSLNLKKLLQVINRHFAKSVIFHKFLGAQWHLAYRWIWQIKTFWLCCTWMYWWVMKHHLSFTCATVNFWNLFEKISSFWKFKSIIINDEIIIVCKFCFLSRFSRKLLWLKVSSTNNDPQVIASYYLECVSNLKGEFILRRFKSWISIFLFLLFDIQIVNIFLLFQSLTGTARRIRADFGTENSNIAGIQRLFRIDPYSFDDSCDGLKSFLYGKSTSNQVSQWYKFNGI